MEHPETRAEAKRLGVKYYFTGVPCKYGHTALRKTKGVCVDCLKVEWENNSVKRAEYYIAYGKSEAGQKAKREYYERNREFVIARANTRPIEERRRNAQNWKRNNLLYVKADNKSRRGKHRQATPKWLTFLQRREMRELYKIAITATQTTGERYVVDHIIPLRSKTVSGLHVPWNLRVITQEENLKKSNHYKQH